MKKLVVFDVDKTIIKENLHEVILNCWVNKRFSNRIIAKFFLLIMKIIPYYSIRRKFEYLIIYLICENELEKITNQIFEEKIVINQMLLKRIKRYQNNNFEMALVTAAPERVVRNLAVRLGIKAYARKTFCGVVYSDLLGKKYKIYNRLEAAGYRIRSIYSDSLLDFYGDAKKFLITDKFYIMLKK